MTDHAHFDRGELVRCDVPWVACARRADQLQVDGPSPARASRERSGLILAFVGLALFTLVCVAVWWQR